MHQPTRRNRTTRRSSSAAIAMLTLGVVGLASGDHRASRGKVSGGDPRHRSSMSLSPRRLAIVIAILAGLFFVFGSAATITAQASDATPVVEATEEIEPAERTITTLDLPSGAPETSSLALTVTRCPVGFDLATDTVSDCTFAEDGVAFAVSGPGGDLSGTTGTDGAGRVEFAGLAPGSYSIAMTPPPDVISTFVWDCYQIGMPSEAPAAPAATGSSHSTQIDAGYDTVCQWYVVPIASEWSGDGTVHISKYACPAGVVPSDDDYLLSEQCRDEIDPVTFSISGADGYFSERTATAGVPQSATFPEVPYVTLEISESMPVGFSDVRAFCSDSAADGPGAYVPAMRVDADTFSWEHRADADLELSCVFFNFAEGGDGGTDGTGTVRVSKYTCPEGVDRASDDYALSEVCRVETEPVSFEISDVAGADIPLTLNPGVPQDGEVSNLAFGTVWISEIVPSGYGEPLVFCSDTPADGAGNYEPVPVIEGNTVTWELRADAGMPLTCIFFNVPDDEPGNTVTVNKYTCPSWVNAETDILLDTCAPGGDGIPFEFVDGNGRHPAAISGGSVTWTDVVIGVEGELQIIETIPAGYGDPIVVCDGMRMESTNGFVVPNPGDERPFHVTCNWFNLALEDASLAVVKHTCAPGYDLHAAGADPTADCAELTDGVDFRIAGMGTDMTSMTGDAGTGMVQFGGLDPGTYTLTESVPDGTALSFVLDCYGNDLGAVRPYPLATGGSFDLTVHAGEEITCHWFNVPDRKGGALTVIKYLCTGDAYVSDVDCQIHEDGVTFDLVVRDGDAWVTVDTATTDGHGRIAWTGLAPGRYWLGEYGSEWCHIASAHLDDDPAGIVVDAGHEAVVKVYNCGATPGQPGETPTTFPDTGVPPAGSESGIEKGLPTGALAGLLSLALTRRRLAALAVAVPPAGMMGRAVAQDGDQVIEPMDGTAGPEVVPTSLCLPSSEAGCTRGPVPGALRIDAIGVDAPVEILETVAGEMQQPTDALHVAWYKETARLGETGNMLLAGHLNWWGVPEAVFYNLARLEGGDEIVIDGDTGERRVYVVEWVRQMAADETPGDDVLGMTAWPAVTLITCGGSWDAGASAYDARTVVRARVVDVA